MNTATQPIKPSIDRLFFGTMIKTATIFTPLLLFIAIYVAIVAVLFKYIQSQFKDIRHVWFFQNQPISYEDYFYLVINTIAQSNTKDCNHQIPNTKYCHPTGSASSTHSSVTDAIANTNKEDKYTIKNSITQYVSEKLYNMDSTVDLRISLPNIPKVDLPSSINIPKFDIPKIDINNPLNYTTRPAENTDSSYLLSYVPDLGKLILEKVPKPFKKITYVSYILFLIAIIAYFLYWFSRFFTPSPDARILYIWEDRNDTAFTIFVLIYILCCIVAYISIKHFLFSQNPIRAPFVTAFFNFPNMNTLRSSYSDNISSFRSSNYPLEGFQTTTSFDDNIEEKLRKIRETKAKPSLLDTLYATVSRQIDSIQKQIQYFILRAYLSKENTIKRVI
jgi:uncharacterized metal-binding protein